MNASAKWIWLDKSRYPLCQKSGFTHFDNYEKTCEYVVGEFKYEKFFDKKIKKAEIDICADVKFSLYVNGDFIGVGPVCQGGDYANIKPMPIQYFNNYTIDVDSSAIEFYVAVQKNITVQCDMSRGRPGLIISAKLYFDDGTTDFIVSDRHWLCRRDQTRRAVNQTDFTAPRGEWAQAEEIADIWNLKRSPLKNLIEENIRPTNFSTLKIPPKNTFEITLDFDKIYSGYYTLSTKSSDKNGVYAIHISEYEKDENKAVLAETIIARGNISFRGMQLRSVGAVKLTVLNYSSSELEISDFSLRFSHYPVTNEGDFECSDDILNRAYALGKHTLKICRQTIELDSPNHQENLGCTGDYHIASLMNYFTYGDTELTRLDLIRTADYLCMTDGYMFHTSYSMIWILMLYDYYIFSGDNNIFAETKSALICLLERFHRFTDERSIITSPDSFMFLDWLEIDGISLHHPPACLGQAALNAFYCGGLCAAVKIFSVLGDDKNARLYSKRLEKLKSAFNNLFYDKEKGLYFDGLNEDYEEKQWVPKNTQKKYYSWHTNSLAVLFDIAPKSIHSEILERILGDMTLINPQPYFMHFVLEAVYKAGLFEKHGIPQLLRWKKMTEFPKGLQEGWYDMSGYGFDYSHVWGGTPTYQLPSKILGFEMIEPGFKKIRLKPNLFGLNYAKISVPTPYGYIRVQLEQGKTPQIDIPPEIEYVLE